MKRILSLILLFACITVHSQDIIAAGTMVTPGSNGLRFDTYASSGPSPSYLNADGTVWRTKTSSGAVSAVDFNWGGGAILNSGRSDGTIVHFYGYLNIPASGTYYFGMHGDDGVKLNIGGTQLIDSWVESGGAFRQTAPVYVSAGTVSVDMWYYENGGGAVVTFYWFKDNTWSVVPTTNLATDITYFQPALCCGGSASFDPAAAAAYSTNSAKVTAFNNRTTADSQVSIEQIGSSNTITVDQTGTKNNYTKYSGNGNSNSINITQSGNSTTQANYIEAKVNGNSNNVNLTQQSTGGTKGTFVTVNNNDNNVTVLQKDSGSHYLDLTLSGGSKTVGVEQSGSAGHKASITLTGGPTNLNLTQTGSTQQTYQITHNCASNCTASPITVTQGQ